MGIIDLGSCFGAKKCALCEKEFKTPEERYMEIEGLGCVCQECWEKYQESLECMI